MTNQQGGFEQPRQYSDPEILKLLAKHNLPENASLEQIEPKATELLNSPLTFIEGTQLVLGRTVDAKETDILGPILMGGRTGEDRFGVALLTLATEDLKTRK